MSNPTAKSCPFCGSKDVEVIINYTRPNLNRAECKKCLAEARLDVWNRRCKPANPWANWITSVSEKAS